MSAGWQSECSTEKQHRSTLPRRREWLNSGVAPSPRRPKRIVRFARAHSTHQHYITRRVSKGEQILIFRPDIVAAPSWSRSKPNYTAMTYATRDALHQSKRAFLCPVHNRRVILQSRRLNVSRPHARCRFIFDSVDCGSGHAFLIL